VRAGDGSTAAYRAERVTPWSGPGDWASRPQTVEAVNVLFVTKAPGDLRRGRWRVSCNCSKSKERSCTNMAFRYSASCTSSSVWW
jgi:hypothetical protein